LEGKHQTLPYKINLNPHQSISTQTKFY